MNEIICEHQTTSMRVIVHLLSNYRTCPSGLVEVRASMQFMDIEGYITWLPVFTEWWE